MCCAVSSVPLFFRYAVMPVARKMGTTPQMLVSRKGGEEKMTTCPRWTIRPVAHCKEGS